MAISSILLAAFGLLTLAQAQSNPLDGLPQCAQGCANDILSSSACGSTNGACICSNGPILSTLSCCLLANCTPDETQQAVTFAGNICRLFNAPDVPTAAVCSTSSTTSSSAAPSSTMTPPRYGQNDGMGGSVVPLPSSSSTILAPSDSAMSAAMGGAATTTTSNTAGTGMAASTSASAPAAADTGAASHMGPAMGLAGVVVGGLAAFL